MLMQAQASEAQTAKGFVRGLGKERGENLEHRLEESSTGSE
jgi:hypothetical protein